jgi:hypothetical protein
MGVEQQNGAGGLCSIAQHPIETEAIYVPAATVNPEQKFVECELGFAPSRDRAARCDRCELKELLPKSKPFEGARCLRGKSLAETTGALSSLLDEQNRQTGARQLDSSSTTSWSSSHYKNVN